MKNWATKTIPMISVLALLLVQPALAFDFSSWDGLLKKYVSPKTIHGVRLNAVNYKKLAKDQAYTKLIKDLKNVSLSTLKTREEKLAFWINVYNVMAAKMVLDNYPVEKHQRCRESVYRCVEKTRGGRLRGRKGR